MRLKTQRKTIRTRSGLVKIVILRPRSRSTVPGILWIHGGGYTQGSAEMVHVTAGKMLAKTYGAVVFSPNYRLARIAPYPAALEDCYDALLYMYENADELGISREHIIVGGESAGGGLAAAVCLYARDKGDIPIRLQLPLYPMLDCDDTDSSRDNHGWGWNTRKNHRAWARYLGGIHSGKIPKYASPSKETDYSGLPPCYTFIADGEPFRDEALTYVRRLKAAGINATADIYHSNIHAFDMLFWTKNAQEARKRLREAYEAAVQPGTADSIGGSAAGATVTPASCKKLD